MASTTMTEDQWAQLVLQDAGLPTTAQNVANMKAWMSGENSPSNWSNRDNPLNASLGTSSVDGTGSYGNLTTAAQETAKMINQTNMSSIKKGLSSGTTSTGQFFQDAAASPWASSHYNNPAEAGEGVDTGSGKDNWGGNSVSSNTSAQNNANGTVAGTLAGPAASTALEQQYGNQQTALDNADAGLTNEQLEQQYQDQLQSNALSGQQLGLEVANENNSVADTNQSFGLTQQQEILSGQSLTNELAQLTSQYGYTQQSEALQGTENQQSYANSTLANQQNYANALTTDQSNNAAAGTYNTATKTKADTTANQSYTNDQTQYNENLANANTSLGIQSGQAGSAYNANVQSNQLSQQQLGLTNQQAALANKYTNLNDQNALAQYGIQGQQLALTGTEANQSLQTGLQNTSNTNAQNQLGIEEGLTAGYSAVPTAAGSTLGALASAAPYTGSLTNSGG